MNAVRRLTAAWISAEIAGVLTLPASNARGAEALRRGRIVPDAGEIVTPRVRVPGLPHRAGGASGIESIKMLETASTWALAAFMLVMSVAASAQDSALGFEQRRANVARADAGRTLTGPSTAPQMSVVRAFLRARGASEATLASLRQTQARAGTGGVTHLHLDQQVAGLTVHGSFVRAAITARGELVSVIDKLASVDAALTPATAGEAQALEATLQRLHPDARVAPTPGARDGNTQLFAGGGFFHADPRVTRVAVPMNDGTLSVGFLVETWTQSANLLHHTLVGGDGRVLSIEKRTANDAYAVFVEDPGKGGQVMVNGPSPVATPGAVPSPAGWLGGSRQTTWHITGNNVDAYLDGDANNVPDPGGTAVADGNFLTAWEGIAEPTTTSNRNVAVQNLFYLNNVIHDILYAKGFTEGAGNFQLDNFGRGGAERDPVDAEAQDGAFVGDANFATPPDGRRPRMQMFLWNVPGPTHEVRVHRPVAASYVAVPAVWSTFTVTGMTGEVTLVNDGVGVTSDACEPLLGVGVAHRIALVDRGTCTFAVKAQNVQRAGAAGMIVANNVDGASVRMSDSDVPGIRVPAMMISRADGATLRTLASPNATMHRLVVPQVDPSLDADVAFHEYGHGLTWRMIGGMRGPLAGAVGEGASDALAMLVNGDDVIAEYASSRPEGIRSHRYAGYPRTYAALTGTSVHRDGEIFAAIVWRMIELFDARRDVLFTHFVDGMNFTPPTPAYEDMRDGMLQSIANSTADSHDCGLVWQAFAQFGVGVGASGVVNGATVTITPSHVDPGNTCSVP